MYLIYSRSILSCQCLYRWAFNLTLLITGAFGLAAGGSDRFITLASLLAVVGVGVGGNMPVDSALFLGTLHPSFPSAHLLILPQISSPARTNTSSPS